MYPLGTTVPHKVDPSALLGVQMLLNQFSEANNRLAQDNQRLRQGRQMLATDHAVVLDEIDYLRGRLNRLEGSQSAASGLGPLDGARLDPPAPQADSSSNSSQPQRSQLRCAQPD